MSNESEDDISRRQWRDDEGNLIEVATRGLKYLQVLVELVSEAPDRDWYSPRHIIATALRRAMHELPWGSKREVTTRMIVKIRRFVIDLKVVLELHRRGSSLGHPSTDGDPEGGAGQVYEA